MSRPASLCSLALPRLMPSAASGSDAATVVTIIVAPPTCSELPHRMAVSWQKLC
jgi:hypothetical protein